MDATFGHKNLRNEIVWKRSSAHSDVVQGAKHYGRTHDIILFYSKSDNPCWNTAYSPYDQEYIESTYRYQDSDGRRYQTQPLHAAKPGGDTLYEWKGQLPPPGRFWAFSKENMEKLEREGKIVYSRTGVPRYKIYFDQSLGVPAQDIWLDLSPVHHKPRERLGYPTQKPESILERIIQVSSNEGDLVLDPFCGCGTTIAVAERLKRRWIGIDITHLAISLMRHRLCDTFGPDLLPYEVIGDPKDLSSARALAEQNRYQFEWWTLGLVDARPAQDKRKGADRGVDGYINFFDDNSGRAKTVVVQVKSGGVKRGDIATLKGDREREKAPIGILITLEEPTKPMLEEAATAGYYEPEHFPGYQYPRIQILTIRELLDGKEAQYPRMAPPATFKRAQRHRKSIEDQQRLM